VDRTVSSRSGPASFSPGQAGRSALFLVSSPLKDGLALLPYDQPKFPRSREISFFRPSFSLGFLPPSLPIPRTPTFGGGENCAVPGSFARAPWSKNAPWLGLFLVFLSALTFHRWHGTLALLIVRFVSLELFDLSNQCRVEFR